MVFWLLFSLADAEPELCAVELEFEWNQLDDLLADADDCLYSSDDDTSLVVVVEMYTFLIIIAAVV